ncbi:hypothetical protein FPOAC2_04037 [Fusarium poae]
MDPSEVPWRTGVQSQQLFRNGSASGWFEVGFGAPATQTADEAAMMERAVCAMKQKQEQFEREDKECIKAADGKTDANGWLERVGWANHLQGFDPEAMRRLMDPVGEEEHVLQLIHESIMRVMLQARITATPNTVGSQALFEVQRKEVDKKPRRPFDNRVEEDTWARYTAVWSKLICYVYRAEELDDDKRPGFKLTKQQGDRMDALELMINDHVEDPEANPLDEDKVDTLVLQVVIALLDHRLTVGEYRSAIISGLAVLGIRQDGGWMDAIDYTTTYSAVIKVARAMVVYRSFQERKEEVARLQREKDLDEDEADEEATSMFRIVREKVQKFMTVTSKEAYAEPTPMDWIYEARSYGMFIRFNTPAGGTVDWVGDQIRYRKTRFRMAALTEMLHALTREAREHLATLTMVDDVLENPGIPLPFRRYKPEKNSHINNEQSSFIKYIFHPALLRNINNKSSFIHFTLHFDTTLALFEISIPISYKQHTRTSAICIRINPRSITSLTQSIVRDLPDAAKPIFGFTSAICLDFELNDAVTVLIPSFITEPVTAARKRSGIIINSLYELTQATSAYLHPRRYTVSSTATAQQKLHPFSGPDYDIARWFWGRGAKVTTLPTPPPPSYNKATADQANIPLYSESITFDPPTTSHKRKRSQDAVGKRVQVPDSAVIWTKLLELEATVQHHPPPATIPGDQSQHIKELHAIIDNLQTQSTQYEQKALDRETEVTNLRIQLAQCEKKVLDLETEVAALRDAQDNADNTGSVEISEMQENILDLEGKIDYVTRRKDDDDFAHNYP